MATAANITVGSPSSVKIGAYGAVEGDCVDVGSLEGGAKLTFTPEHYFKKADAWLGKVGAVKTDEDCIADMMLAEVSLANLAYAFGYPTTAVSGSTLSIGGDTTATERTVYINANAPSSGTMKITIHKCVIVGAVELPMLKRDKSTVKLTLQVLEDTAQAAGQHYFSLVYSSTDTTPPTVAMTTPADGAAYSAAGTSNTVTLTFTEATNQIDEGTLIYGNADNATIFLNNVTDLLNVVLVAGTISYNSATKVLTFTPTSTWTLSDKIQVMVTTGIRDTAGNHLANTFYGDFTIAA